MTDTPLDELTKVIAHLEDYDGDWENAARLGRVAARLRALEEEKARAVYLAEHLFQMVPAQAWRDSGGDDGQGHYEGDYFAEKVRDELAALSAGPHAPREPDEVKGPSGKLSLPATPPAIRKDAGASGSQGAGVPGGEARCTCADSPRARVQTKWTGRYDKCPVHGRGGA